LAAAATPAVGGIDVIEAESKFIIAGILDVADNKYMKSLDKSLNLLPSNYNLISHYTTRLM
jgi:hypothetical protein